MKQYGILAYPAKQSLSPVIHNAAFKALKIDAQYGVFEIPEEKLAEFMETVKHEPISGVSVSLPHKEAVMRYLNEIDEDAEKIKAVNTVVNKGGFLWGYNTDFLGSNKALTEVVGDLEDKNVVVIGAGGSARAIIYGLLKEGSNVWIKNRTKEKGDKIAVEFAEMFDAEIHSSDFEEWETGNILIHTTSIWIKNPDLTPESLPKFCDPDYVKEFEVVMDITYNANMTNYPDPLMTPLLMSAKNAGRKIITGDKMLLYQAVEQFKLWTGKKAPVDVMKDALGKSLG